MDGKRGKWFCETGLIAHGIAQNHCYHVTVTCSRSTLSLTKVNVPLLRLHSYVVIKKTFIKDVGGIPNFSLLKNKKYICTLIFKKNDLAYNVLYFNF